MLYFGAIIMSPLHKWYSEYPPNVNHIILYADDSNLFLTGKNVATLIDIMNKEPNKIIGRLHSNKLSLNENKTQYIIFSNKNNNINMHKSITINNIILKKKWKLINSPVL